ncbi:excinuclease ABC subunit UvrC [Campylobacter sp. MIT 21-1685]|uniref:excinuclease ABC subunit UvrC n=1 Tax=unclassified Campylobacter TaxID=2593542 RepID=UPI00224B5A1D|nr:MULTISPECIES: excinuclease ABC subunit UvrC [unclassified Campylobacter]MCX2682525.1 excinuclease ABC subunit UvrC [Campylobacter sp. MIT 21-1684]MCX2750762.1 excinuclease ABC subunit UvrC [Campylobacter sp. MIT 21-1682]MCX2807006.1 excinuclease ABC subunit UvrC [Campylobacter sp. MIT 21-1685]
MAKILLPYSLENELKNLPESPGIYQYFSNSGRLLYVGKAKNLKNRIRSYFTFSPYLQANSKTSLRIQKMIQETTHIEIISTESEADALILENSFIKQLRPKYNILLRDDKTYPYIYVDYSQDYPRFESTRKLIKKKKIKYFGPFFKGVKELLNALYLYYPLKQKNSCKNPCIFYQISRCKAPCAGYIGKEEYAKIVSEATNALLNPSILIRNLEQQMFQLSENENYEEAAKLRNQISIIKALQVKIHIDIAKLEDFEIFALASENNFLSTLRFIIQNGKIISVVNKIIQVKIEYEKNEIYKQLILEHSCSDIPLIADTIYVYEDFEDRKLLENILCKQNRKKIHIKVPKKGEKRRICDLAYQNAFLYLKQQSTNHIFALQKELQKYFELENLPCCVEIFDNSHLQGEANVGAMVCFEGNAFSKSRYRKFHLCFQNDYEQMREVLTRRVLDFNTIPPPDLWLIDGGKALLDLARSILQNRGANVDVLAISKEKIDSKAYRAKGKAKDLIYSSKGKFVLDTDDKKLQFLQRLRDEAHRFALSFHQETKRKQDLQASRLFQQGFSQAKVRKLLSYFGTFEAIYQADFDELQQIIGTQTAKKLQKLSFKE